MKILNRRQFLRLALILFGTACAHRLFFSERAALSSLMKTLGIGPAQTPEKFDALRERTFGDDGPGNFRAVYLNPRLKAEFFFFLSHIYHLYPEEEFHELIADVCSRHATDKEIYQKIQDELPKIKPVLAELTYSLPALREQKAEMTRQTLQLLGARKSFDGYVEIGTTGRYVGELGKSVNVRGPIHIINDIEPSYTVVDMLERGRVAKFGDFAPLADYAPIGARIPDESVELVTNLIGFHHAPAGKLDGFVRSIHRFMKPGGSLIVRDHDVDGDEMNLIVSLAHDVFNAGLDFTWDETRRQVRNFTSVKALEAYLGERGFRSKGAKLIQERDPTRNNLMEFVRV